ncbi:hypothetical protein FACS1894109_18810 [Spirochaetia bacterium]|nr:hypothetical protein FACS1894109_18810 [Spirochaetia bacterium]
MNTNLLTIVKQIIATNGEGILENPQRLKAFFNDLAKDEPKPLRIAFVGCLENGAYNAIKTAPDAAERASCKAAIAQRVRDDLGLDPAISGEALDILEAAIFGAQMSITPLTPQKINASPAEWSIPPVTHGTPAATFTPDPQTTAPTPAEEKKIIHNVLIMAGIGIVGLVVILIMLFQQYQNSASPQLTSEPIKNSSAPVLSPAPVAPAEPPQRPIPANMVHINGGTFMMGSPLSEASRYNAETQHQVTVSGFYMGKYEVTQREYEEMMGTNPSHFKGQNLPVEMVSWNDAVEYCNKWSQKEGLTLAYSISGSGDNRTVTWNRNANGYRLPTEAEWEYACRAGTTTPFNTGNYITTSQANYDGNYPYYNAKGEYRGKTTAVGSFAPNRWSLYDMHGNVREWCWDWYGDYSSGTQTDPSGLVSGSNRVVRGGSWNFLAVGLRSAFRIYFTPSYRGDFIGFRLVRPEFRN